MTQIRKTMFEFEGIGTHWWCESLNSQPITDELQKEVVRYVEAFNHAYTRFRDDSLIGQLNSKGIVMNPPPELYDMFIFAKEMYDVSDGAFNISIGGKLHESGYGSRDRAAKVWDDPWPHIVLDADKITIPADMTLDFGGFGKGWLIDALVDMFKQHGMNEFIINGGGDMYVAANEPVLIALEHPFEPASKIGDTKVMNGALAVSANNKRRWTHADKEYMHIMDPQLPVSNEVAAVYVKAASARIADTLATILFLRPNLKDILSQRYSCDVVIVRTDQLKTK